MMSRPMEICCACGDPTGHAGAGEDSSYTDSGQGPFCDSCYDGAKWADSRIRELDAALCRVGEAYERFTDANTFFEGSVESVEAALSSTGPCRHEEEAKRLREAVEWALGYEEDISNGKITKVYRMNGIDRDILLRRAGR